MKEITITSETIKEKLKADIVVIGTGDTTGSRFINRGGERIEIINDMTWAVASGYLAGENIGKHLETL